MAKQNHCTSVENATVTTDIAHYTTTTNAAAAAVHDTFICVRTITIISRELIRIRPLLYATAAAVVRRSTTRA